MASPEHLAGSGDPADLLVLGPVGLAVAGRFVVPSSRTGLAVLAALALAGDHGLSTDALFETVWGSRRARSVESTVTVTMHRLRQWLRQHAGDSVAVGRTESGYRLELAGGRLDLARFRAALERDRAEPDRAAVLAEALGQWRGPALANVPADSVDRAAVTALEREWCTAAVEYGRLAVAAGGAGRAVELLAPVADRYPLDEPVQAVWFEVLASTGRQAEALEGYERLRSRLRDELGVDPSQELTAALVRVLRRNETEPVPAQPATPVPAQLPADPTVFRGRAAELELLDRWAAERPGGLWLVTGGGGVGKTTLAVRWAHRAAGRFPDGQLYLDLRGFSGTEPVPALTALARFLRALGVAPDAVPVDLDEAAALYRTLLAGRRMLILLDNAAQPDQVRPLLPGAAGSLVLVTSRDRLDGLVVRDGARRLALDVLDAAASSDLVATLIGADRTGAEPGPVAELVGACAGLPLALRVAAAHLLGRPGQRIADYLAELGDRDRAGRLAVDGDPQSSVWATFELSYRRLPGPARRALRLVGSAPGTDIGVPAVAALLGVAAGEADRLLHTLTAGHLLTEPGPGRYGCHDLIRDYAGELVQQEEPAAERTGATARLLTWYLRGATAAADILGLNRLRPPIDAPLQPVAPPPVTDHDTAQDWLAAEAENLMAVVQHTAEHGPPEYGWLLLDQLRDRFTRGEHRVPWRATVTAAGQAADRRDVPAIQALTEITLSSLEMTVGHPDRIILHARNALELSRRAGWPPCEAAALSNIGTAMIHSGDLDEAVKVMQQAITVARGCGRDDITAYGLSNLAIVDHNAGRLEDAVEHHLQAVELYERLGWPVRAVGTFNSLAASYGELGRFTDAQDALRRAIELCDRFGVLRVGGVARANLAETYHDLGDHRQALRYAREAVEVAAVSQDQVAELLAQQMLAAAERTTGHLDEALARLTAALPVARTINQPRMEAELLIGLSRVYHDLRRFRQARRCAQHALAIGQDIGLPVIEGQALTALAQAHLSTDRYREATGHAQQAAEQLARAGNRLGQARALQVQAEATERVDGRRAADPLWRAAHAILAELGTADAAELAARLRTGPAAR